MNRRRLIHAALGSGFLNALDARRLQAQEQAARAVRGLPSPIIKNISVITTQPANARLVVVKVTTDQDGLYGYGCATFTQRADLVVLAVEKYLKPLLIGRPADRIEDTWQMMYNSSYWRNGPVLNNAMSGVDEALWDIKGRQAGMPVYQLLGGKCREAAAVFVNVGGSDIKEIVDGVRQAMARGYRHVRVRRGDAQEKIRALHNRPVWDPTPNLRHLLEVFEACRKELGFEVELMHDMHERYPPQLALSFVKECERFKLFFLEDPFSPEDLGWFRLLRSQSTTPIAMGELFNSPHEWTPLIPERLIDYIRIHVSQAGGVTPCRKIAILGEFFGVKTAWHGPGDCSPIGHAANLHLDLASYNFGIQEGGIITGVTAEIFRGCPTFKDGYLYASDAPGWGIEVDEKLAAKFPFREAGDGARKGLNGGWGDVRLPDGTVIKQ